MHVQAQELQACLQGPDQGGEVPGLQGPDQGGEVPGVDY